MELTFKPTTLATALKGPWAPATIYKTGDVVTYLSQTWMVNAPFTSGATFATANLTLLAGRGKSEIAYAQRTTNFSPGTNAMTSVPGMSFSVVSDGSDYVIDFGAYLLSNGTIGGNSALVLQEGGVNAMVRYVPGPPVAGNGMPPYGRQHFRNRVAGTTYSYQMAMFALSGSTPIVQGSAADPIWMQASYV